MPSPFVKALGDIVYEYTRPAHKGTRDYGLAKFVSGTMTALVRAMKAGDLYQGYNPDYARRAARQNGQKPKRAAKP